MPVTLHSKKPVFTNCYASSFDHARGGRAWTCRACGAVACSTCAKYHWKSRAGTAPGAKSTPFATHPEERVGTCSKCARGAS